MCSIMLSCACHLSRDTINHRNTNIQVNDAQTLELKDTMKNLLLKVNEISVAFLDTKSEVCSLRQKIDQLSVPTSSQNEQRLSDHHSSPGREDSLLPQVIDNESDIEMSDNSIDEFVPLEQIQNKQLNLNCQAPTNQ